MATASHRAPVRHRQKIIAVMAIALIIRVFLIFYFRTWDIASDRSHWDFGYETGQVARSLAEGRGFASPFIQPTGPTGWLAPAYPWLLSLLFRAFGIFSPAAAVAALILNAVLAAATCLVVYLLGRSFFDEATGLVASVFFALNPASMWHTITSIWDVTASAFLLAMLVYALRRLQCRQTQTAAAIAGVLAGVMALFNPSCLIVYAAGAAWICLRKPLLAPVLALAPLALSLPWALRNEAVLHRFTLKSNFGTELRIGNNPLAGASAMAAVMDFHPSFDELAIYQRMGETAYVDWCGQQAWRYIREHPDAFGTLVLRRILIFWTGSEEGGFRGNLKTRSNLQVLKRIVPSVLALAALAGLALGLRWSNHALLFLTIAVYPLPFYLTHVTNRYRLPLVPFLAVLAAHAFVWVWRRTRHTAPLPVSGGRERPKGENITAR